VFILRNFRPHDLDQVSSLVEKCLREQYSHSFYLTIFNIWPNGFIVAEHENRIIGVLVGVVSAPKEGRVLILGVDENMRRKGVGSALLDAFIEECTRYGLKTVTLEVRVTNEVARHFYQKRGFEVIGLIPHYYHDGEDGYQMRRVL